MSVKNVTRGFGFLETFLSFQRVKKANKIIYEHKKSDLILDLGCGSYSYFLTQTKFNTKFGIDQVTKNLEFKHQNITLINHDINDCSDLPFKDNYFDVITILAVIEHINRNKVNNLLRKCYSLLKKDGILIITVPAKWSNIPLKLMAKLYIVSPEEINEHKNKFTLQEIKKKLCTVNFQEENIRAGYFEFFLNVWICAKK